jgi:UDP:flavonoid glycosyltransferase YjiC (YdhE family)
MVVWPEYGHVVTLLALAKQLSERQYRVIFAGVRTFEQPMRALGYEYANLSAARAGAEPTLFACPTSRRQWGGLGGVLRYFEKWT